MAIKNKSSYESNKKLISYLDSLDRANRRVASILIRNACMIPYHKYTGWLKCTTALEPLYCKTIEKAIGKDIFSSSI